MKEPIKVVCGIIFRNNQVLICRRKVAGSLGGFWEFPGGKIEYGETPEECLKRELREELGLAVGINEHFLTVEHQYAEFKIELSSYLCECTTSEIILADHDAYEWVEISKLQEWRLAPADVSLAKNMISLNAG